MVCVCACVERKAQPPFKTRQFVCLFVVGSDGMSILQQLTMQEMDGVCVCVCVWKGNKFSSYSCPIAITSELCTTNY
jgi:hypothetical protein